MNDERKRVVLVTGAIAPYTNRLYNGLGACGEIDLHVLTCQDIEPQRKWRTPTAITYTQKSLAGLRYHRSYTSHVYFNPGVVTELRRLRPASIMIGGFSPTMMLAAFYANSTGTPLGIGTDGSLETDPGQSSSLHRLARKILVPRASFGTAASENSARLLARYGLPSNRCTIVPIPIAWDAPSVIPTFEEREFDVLFAGAIDDDRKGALFFADVIDRCRTKGTRLKVRITGDGPLRSELERRLRDCGVDAQFDGYLQQDDLATAYSSAKLLLFPSRGDPWGLVANEAILCGAPIIASPHAVSSIELVARYRAGVVLPLEVEAWSNATLELLSSRDKWTALQANHAAASQSFNVDMGVSAMLKALDMGFRHSYRHNHKTAIPRSLIAAGLKGAHSAGVHKIMGQRFAPTGVIYTLHRVDPRPVARADFAPHHHLSITPEFLRDTIAVSRANGFEPVSIDEAAHRLQHGRKDRFSVFTLDDGYRDNLEHAYPVFKAANVPFVVYVPSSWPDGGGVIWWRALEDIVAAFPLIETGLEGLPGPVKARTAVEKKHAFDLIYDAIIRLDSDRQIAVVRGLAKRYGVSLPDLCRREMMSWDELRQLAGDPLATIGSHSQTHATLVDLSDDALLDELVASRASIEHELGKPCRHLAYPYGFAGQREYDVAVRAGYTTAVTTRRGLIGAGHRNQLTALPRISLDGDMQDTRCVEVQITGALFALRRGFRTTTA